MTEYNRREFHIPASDTRGHNRRCEFRAQPGHVRQAELIVQSTKFPYRTRGDLYRHALHIHLAYLETLEPVNSVMKQVDLILECMRDDENAADFRISFEKLGERIAYHDTRSAEGEVRRLVMFAQKKILDMPEGYWRDQYLKELIERYGKHIKDAPKASLTNFSEEED